MRILIFICIFVLSTPQLIHARSFQDGDKVVNDGDLHIISTVPTFDTLDSDSAEGYMFRWEQTDRGIDFDYGTSGFVPGAAYTAAPTFVKIHEIMGASAFSTEFNIDNADVDFFIYGDTNDKVVTFDAGTENVGIGTSTPSAKLEVNGTIIGDNIKQLGAPTNDPTSFVLGSNSPISLVTSGAVDVTFVDAQQLVEFTWAYVQGALPADGFELRVIDNNSFETRNLLSSDSTKTYVVMDAQTFIVQLRAFRITSAGMEYGTAQEVEGGISSDSGDSSRYARLLGRSGGQVIIGGTETADDLTLQATSGIGTGANVIINVGNNGATEALRVEESGNVGIGTSVPATKLDVNGLITTNTGLVSPFFNGTFVESFNAVATSNGTTITLSVEQAGGGDLTERFSDGMSTYDTTPADTIALTAGSDVSPTENFIYILQSAKGTLVKSTSDWPSAEHIRIGYFLTPSATFVQSNGLYINQNWNDHASGTDGQGHLTHLMENMRLTLEGSHWHTGVAPTVTITTNVGTPDNIDIATTAGTTFQAHRHSVAAFDSAVDGMFLIVNDNATPYKSVADLNGELTDSAGGSMSGRYFNLTQWCVGNKGGEFSPTLINLPSGSYNVESDAINDVDRFNNDTMPIFFTEESSTGFLVARYTFKHSNASGGTWTLSNTVDLRGTRPGGVGAGGAGTSTTDFSDNQFSIFDDGDVTKILNIQASGITTGTTRTLTVPDNDGTIALTSDGLTIGDAITGGTSTRLLYEDSSNQLAEDTSLNYDDANDRFAVGLASASATGRIHSRANDVSFTFPLLELEGNSTLIDTTLRMEHFNTSMNPTIEMRRSLSSTMGTIVETTDGDVLGEIEGWGAETSPVPGVAASIIFKQDGSSGAEVPGKIEFHTGTSSATPTIALTINSDKTLTLQTDLAVTEGGTGASSLADLIALTTDTTGNYVDDATASQGLTLTGTEGATLGLQDCAANEVLARNAGDTAWACAVSGGTNTSLVFGTSVTARAATHYVGVGGANSATLTNSDNTRIPVSGTLSNLYIRSSVTPGSGGDQWVGNFVVNGSVKNAGGEPSATITAAIQEAEDNTNTLSISAGDHVAVRFFEVNTVASARTGWAAVFTPD